MFFPFWIPWTPRVFHTWAAIFISINATFVIPPNGCSSHSTKRTNVDGRNTFLWKFNFLKHNNSCSYDSWMLGLHYSQLVQFLLLYRLSRTLLGYRTCFCFLGNLRSQTSDKLLIFCCDTTWEKGLRMARTSSEGNIVLACNCLAGHHFQLISLWIRK